MSKINFRDGFSILQLKTVGFREVGIAVRGLPLHRGEVHGDGRHVDGRNTGFVHLGRFGHHFGRVPLSEP